MITKSISEYGFIGCDNVPTNNYKFVGARDLDPKLFKELYDYWLEDKETQKIFTFENKNCLKATSYVGIIQTKNLSIEILPKIYDDKSDKDNVRNIFINMLKPILDMNEVQIDKADLSVTKNKNIYEMFISLFVSFMDILIHKGLKSEYILKEDNQYFLKGKLKINENIRKNYIHKERFYVEFDEYLPNRVENRLLKSTIQLLLKKTNDYENKKALRQQLFIFDEVTPSSSYDIDISKINLHRGMEYYKTPLLFAKVFLKHESFTSLRGKDNVFALLFPMETVFEKYMEFVLNNSKELLEINKVMVNGGKNEYLVSNDSCQMARLEPDYLLEMTSRKYIVTDAKWKLIEEKENKNCNTVNISSGDVYQIFAYLNFYDCEDTAYLFVPKINDLKNTEFKYKIQDNIIGGRYRNLKIKIIPIDLDAVIKSKNKIEIVLIKKGLKDDNK